MTTPPPATEAEAHPPTLVHPLRRVGARLRRGRIWLYVGALGPGVIAAAAGNDAGGIATYSTVGADYGYQMLWVMVVVTILFALVQEMCARMGAVTGKGLSDLIREQFGLRWSAFATLILLAANTGVTITEFVGIGAAADLFGIPRWLAVPPMALLLWVLITQGSYARVEKLFIALTLVFISYIVTVIIINPPWGVIGQALITPDLSKLTTAGYLPTVVALIGTTITPYIQLYTQSSVVEKGVTPADYKYERVDVIGGVLLSNLVSVVIIIATAATLFAVGQHVGTAADAAAALRPVAGSLAEELFGVGLFGACMLAAAVLPLSTAYAVTEAIGLERGVSFSFRQAPFFVGLFTFLIVLGTVVAMLPGIPVVALLLFVQTVNGILLPIELIFIMLLVNNKGLMGRYVNPPLLNILAWVGVGLIILAVGAMFASLLGFIS